MIEISMTELALMVWAILASAGATHYRAQARHRGELLLGASRFVQHIVTNDDLRDELARVLKETGDLQLNIRKGE